MVAAGYLDDLKAVGIQARDQGVVDPQQSPAPRTASPGRLCAASGLVRRLKCSVFEHLRHTPIERPNRSRIEVAHDESRVARIGGNERFERLGLGMSKKRRREWLHCMGRLEMDVDEIDGAIKPWPILRIENDPARVSMGNRDSRVISRMAHRDAHPLKLIMRFEAAVGQFARDRLSTFEAQLLGGKDIDLESPDQIDECVRVGPPPPEVS